MKTGGYFVISLDFELMWGMFDKVSIESYGENIRAVHQVVPELLSVFASRNIHATWATVGMVAYEDHSALLAALPPKELLPTYPTAALSSYKHFDAVVSTHPELAPYYFAPELVKLITKTKGQELASHTFSHFYCRAGTKNGEDIFSADLDATAKAFKKFKVEPTTIVFPRNQTTKAALHTLAAHGYTCYRGNEDSFLYRNGTESPLLIRFFRLLDAYVNLTGHHTHKVTALAGELINVPSSRFLRPYIPSLRLFEQLRLRRIKRAMTYAAERGELFHLWWHPHNFGKNRKENFAVLLSLLDHFETLRQHYGMQSATMNEVAKHAGVTPDATL